MKLKGEQQARVMARDEVKTKGQVKEVSGREDQR